MASISALLFAAHLRETLHFPGQLKAYTGRGGEDSPGQQKDPPSCESGFSNWLGWERGEL